MVELSALAPDALDLPVSADCFARQSITLLEPGPIVEYVDDHHDFPEGHFEDFVFLRASKKHVRIASRPLAIPPAPEIDRVGLEFLRIDMARPRLTTVAAMNWGADARLNAVDLDRSQCLRYLRRNPIRLTERQLEQCTGRTFLLIRHRDQGLGVGFLESTRREDDDYRRVRSMYPRAFAADLTETSPFGNPD